MASPDYIVAHGQDADELESSVRLWLAAGYLPQGGLCSHHGQLCQALVRSYPARSEQGGVSSPEM